MKKLIIIASVCMVFVLMLVTGIPVLAANTTYTSNQTVTQTNWRAYTAPFATTSTYNDSGPYTYIATGNSLHETFSYEPAVSDQTGGNHVYVFNNKTGNYDMNSGIISYYYMGMTMYNIWTGNISFNGEPVSDSNQTATGGQLNQWIFAYSPGVAPFTYAVDMGSGWWLIGFSTYTYGSTPLPSDFSDLASNPPHLPG